MTKLSSLKTRYFVLLFIFFAALLFTAGCAKDKKEPLEQAMFTWKEKAKKFEGYSPSPEFSEHTLEQTSLADLNKKPERPIEEEKKLPTTPVSIKVTNVPAGVIIATLARKEKINILNSEKITGAITLNLKRVPWNQIFKTILRDRYCTYEWEGDVLRILTPEDIKQEAELAEVLLKKKAGEKKLKKFSPTETKVIKIQFAEVKNIQKTLEDMLQETTHRNNEQDKNQNYIEEMPARVIVDEHTNSLILRGPKSEVDLMVNLIKVVDVPTSQINIKAYIVETTQETGRDLGVQWGGDWRAQEWGSGGNKTAIWGSGTKTTINGEETNTNEAPGIISKATGVGAGGLGLNLKIGNNLKYLDAQLAALAQKKKINILSNPSITTIDNVMAFTESGAKIPYAVVEDGKTTVKFEEAILRLEITPHVVDKRYLKMDIKIRKDEVDMTRSVQGNPLIIKKETQTSLIVENKETIVISGLTKTKKGKSNSGVPGLKNAPVLGWLFKGQASTEEMHDVLIFITPKVLPRKSNTTLTKISTLEKLEKLTPTHDVRAIKWQQKTKKLLAQKLWDETIRAASIALSLDPGLKRTYCDRARAYLEKEEFQKSYDDSLTALYMDKRNARAYRLQGLALEGLRKLQKALESLEKGCGLGDRQACKEHRRLYYQHQ